MTITVCNSWMVEKNLDLYSLNGLRSAVVWSEKSAVVHYNISFTRIKCRGYLFAFPCVFPCVFACATLSFCVSAITRR